MHRGVFVFPALLIATFTFPLTSAAQTLDMKDLSCTDCHGTQVHDFLKSRHAAALASLGKTKEDALCGACHGEVEAHAQASKPSEVPVQYRYRDPKSYDPTQVQATCLSCHAGGTRAIPQDGRHWLNGANCLTCHTGMAKGGWPKILRAPEQEMCGACHTQALAPVRTGHRTTAPAPCAPSATTRTRGPSPSSRGTAPSATRRTRIRNRSSIRPSCRGAWRATIPTAPWSGSF